MFALYLDFSYASNLCVYPFYGLFAPLIATLQLLINFSKLSPYLSFYSFHLLHAHLFPLFPLLLPHLDNNLLTDPSSARTLMSRSTLLR